ncbi:MAG: MetQ/NlpA family ABC transporter substrate-binding protein, partial [Clostridia bacterium]
MKKLLAILLVLVLSLSLGSALAGEKVSVIATMNPHAEILELVKDDLAALGYDLELTVVTDYVVENPATSAGEVDANFFQHIPYLAGYNAEVSEAEKLIPVI